MHDDTMDDGSCDTLQVIVVDDGLLARCGCGWASATASDGRDAGDRWDGHRADRLGSRDSSQLSDAR